MPGVGLQRSPDFAAIDCQCTEMLPDDWTSAAGPSAVPRVNRRAFPYCPLDVRRIPPVTKTPGPGHTQSPQTTQDSTAKSRRRYSDGSPSPQPPEPDAHTHALSPCSLVLHSLPVTHTGAKWGRQPITTNRERFQHLVRLHLAIIDLFCDSVSTMTPTAQRWTPQHLDDNSRTLRSDPLRGVWQSFFATNHRFYQCSLNPDWHGAWFPWYTWG